jgi:hypothetical protein
LLGHIADEALHKKLQFERMKNALKTCFGVWKDEDHPELQSGVAHYVRNQRKSTRSKRVI